MTEGLPADADPLADFLAQWLHKRPFVVPFYRPLQFRDRIIGSVLYRAKPWQVQLFQVMPDSVIPQHRHPNVDSFEVYLGGDIQFTIDGQTVTHQCTEADATGKHPHFGKQIRVRPHTWHGGTFGKNGGAFLSVQHWGNGIEPTTVGDDWEPDDKHTQEDRSHPSP